MRDAVYEHSSDYAEIIGCDDNRIKVDYELFVDNGVKETSSVGVTIVANNVVIDDNVHIAPGGGFIQWGNLIGDIDAQTDLIQMFSDVDDDIEAEALAREHADTAEATARANADTAEATARANADIAESTARSNADTALGQRIDGLASSKADKIPAAVEGDIVQFDENGNIEDSDVSVTTVTAHMADTVKHVTSQDKDNWNDAVSDVADIQALIPNQATSTNQLADKDFVNSSVQTATAIPRGTYNLVNDLLLTTSASRSDIELALLNAVSVADTNDYCYVEIPTSDSTPTEILRYERYKYGTNSWVYEYILPNSGFTSAQWKALNSNITAEREASYQSHINDGTVHVTTANKSAWNAKYDKPSGGIPSTDMTSAVQTSLGKADSAYQKPSAGIPKTDLASGVQTSLGLADSAYQKPSGGILKTDLASAVQTSLGKADTALQDGDAVPPYSVDQTYWDTKPTDGSVKPVISGGIADAISVEDGEHIEITNIGTIPSSVNSYALVHTLNGVSRVENNIITNGNFDNGNGWTFVTASGSYSVADNIAKIIMGGNTQVFQLFKSGSGLGFSYVAGHTYLVFANVKCSATYDFKVVQYETGNTHVGGAITASANQWTLVPSLFTAGASGQFETNLQSFSFMENGDIIEVKEFVVTDLTLYFNGGTIQTLTEIQSKYPELLEPRAYNAGEIVDSTYTSVTSVGANMLNPTVFKNRLVELGGTDNEDGTVTIQASALQGNTIWENTSGESVISVKLTGTNSADYANLLIIYTDGTNTTLRITASGTWITSTSGKTVKSIVGMWATGSTTFVVSQCGIFIGSTTTWSDYMTDTLSIPSVTLRSAGSVSDTLDVESGEVTRCIGSVDLSTLSFVYNSDLEVWYAPYASGVPFSSARKNLLYHVGTSESYLAMNADKAMLGYYMNDGTASGAERIYIRNGSSTIAPTGVFYYELATPTTESVSPVLNNTLKIETGGTVYAEQSNEPEVDSDFIISYPSDIKSAIVRASGGGGSSVIVVDNLTTESSTSALSARQGKVLDDKIQGIVDIIYPVGSIYMSRNSTSPASLFGGTWTAIEDKFLMTKGSTYTQAGGSASVTLQEANLPAHSHGFTPEGSVSVETDPTFSGTSGTVSVSGANHRHSISGKQYSGSNWATFAFTFHQARDNASAYTEYSGNLSMSGSFTPSGTVSGGSYAFTGTSGDTDTTGSGTSFSILPPFDVVYAWERIA